MSLTVWGPQLITMVQIRSLSLLTALLGPELGFLRVSMTSKPTLFPPIVE